MVSRQGPANSSAAFRNTAARDSHGISDHSCQAARAAFAASATSDSVTWWQTPSLWPWSCGHNTSSVLPLRASLPPMTAGMSTSSPSISSSRFLRLVRSGEPGA